MIIQGLVEEKDEDYEALSTKIDDFFTQEMELAKTISYSDAYRKGKFGQTDRPVCIKLTHPSDTSTIFKNASTLKGKENPKKKAYLIRDDQNDAQQEVRKHLRDLHQENKELEESKRKVIRIH